MFVRLVGGVRSGRDQAGGGITSTPRTDHDLYDLSPLDDVGCFTFQGRSIPDLCDLYDLYDLPHVAEWDP